VSPLGLFVFLMWCFAACVWCVRFAAYLRDVKRATAEREELLALMDIPRHRFAPTSDPAPAGRAPLRVAVLLLAVAAVAAAAWPLVPNLLPRHLRPRPVQPALGWDEATEELAPPIRPTSRPAE
jgi:hypothetical protein